MFRKFQSLGRVSRFAVMSVAAMALLITMIACEESGSPSTTTDASISTATPTSVVEPWASSAPRLTAKQLLAEREANATRFDATRKDKWVRVSGRVERIDDRNVYLLGDGFLSDVVLEDLSQEVQTALNVGQDFSAACKVGNYILGSIFMYDCQADSTPAPGVAATAMPRPMATTPEPTATCERARERDTRERDTRERDTRERLCG